MWVGEGTEAVYSQEPRFPKGSHVLPEAATCWLSVGWGGTALAPWIRDSSDQPYQAFSHVYGQRERERFSLSLVPAAPQGLVQTSAHPGPLVTMPELCVFTLPSPTGTSSLSSCTGLEAGVYLSPTPGGPKRLLGPQDLGFSSLPHSPGQVARKRLGGTCARESRARRYVFLGFVPHANPKKDGSNHNHASLDFTSRKSVIK